MLLHPGQSQDYWVLGSDCNQERNGLIVQNIDLQYEEHGVQSEDTGSSQFTINGLDFQEILDIQHSIMITEVGLREVEWGSFVKPCRGDLHEFRSVVHDTCEIGCCMEQGQVLNEVV